jgi:hypothetical protein
LPPEEAGRHFGITICEKSPAEAAVALAAAKLQEVAALRHAVSELLPTLCEKSPTEAAVVITAANCQEVAALCYTV